MGPSAALATRTRRDRVWWAAGMVVIVAAALLRLVALDHPPRMYFDEVYYAEDAVAVSVQGVEERRPAHPPLGPALLSLGVLALGDGPWGWRVVPALAGVGVVLFTGLAARRLGLLPAAVVAAGLFVAVDGLSLTMSRIAMLDGLVALFVVAGFWMLLGALDRSPGEKGWMSRLAGAGALFGLATAVKWSGLLALAAAGTVAAAHSVIRLRQGRSSAGPGRAVAGVVLSLAVIPAVAYVASYAGWFANFDQTEAAEARCPEGGCTTDLEDLAAVWWAEQVRLVDYHRRLPATHPYRSAPEKWPLLLRPVLYYYEDCPVGRRIPPGECQVDPGRAAKILGLGNPALWWAFVPAFGVVAWQGAVRRRQWALMTGAFLLVLYVPWFFAGKEGYLFYLAPLVPFLAISVSAAAVTVGRRWRWAVAALAVLAVASFVYFAPIWYGISLTEEAADARMWLESWR